MSEPAPPFTTLTRLGGYLPIEDHGLIGDGSTAALVGRDGAVVWLCVPRFDDEPLFCSVLDQERGGEFRITPEDLVEARQYYDPETALLVTEMRSTSGVVRVTDCLALRHHPPSSGRPCNRVGDLLGASGTCRVPRTRGAVERGEVGPCRP